MLIGKAEKRFAELCCNEKRYGQLISGDLIDQGPGIVLKRLTDWDGQCSMQRKAHVGRFDIGK